MKVVVIPANQLTLFNPRKELVQLVELSCRCDHAKALVRINEFFNRDVRREYLKWEVDTYGLIAFGDEFSGRDFRSEIYRSDDLGSPIFDLEIISAEIAFRCWYAMNVTDSLSDQSRTQ